MRRWFNSWGTALVLSYPLNRYESMKVINGMLMQAVAERLLSQETLSADKQQSGDCQICIFLDEVQVLPMLPCLPNLLNLSGKFGGAVILATQSKSLLNSIYSKDIAEGMGKYNSSILNRNNPMNPVVIRPSSWLTTGIRVEKVNNLNLFKFTEELGSRLQELLDKKKADLLTPEEAAELEAIGELDTIFSYINATIASGS
ncbi:MAG: type IV secretion system DNA-binding domain-containing protein [Nostoc sp. LPT]|nr:type IV secretion system DNA-binding domain-containing protein [Nostoc sp. LPT]